MAAYVTFEACASAFAAPISQPLASEPDTCALCWIEPITSHHSSIQLQHLLMAIIWTPQLDIEYQMRTNADERLNFIFTILLQLGL